MNTWDIIILYINDCNQVTEKAHQLHRWRQRFHIVRCHERLWILMKTGSQRAIVFKFQVFLVRRETGKWECCGIPSSLARWFPTCFNIQLACEITNMQHIKSWHSIFQPSPHVLILITFPKEVQMARLELLRELGNILSNETRVVMPNPNLRYLGFQLPIIPSTLKYSYLK